MATRSGKIILGLMLVLMLSMLGSAAAQSIKTFTGKISEIARGTELDIAKYGTFFVLRLAESPQNEFRISRDDAVKYGVIDAAGPTGVMTPKQAKGLGWKVKLTCNGPTGSLKNPVYKILSLERLSD